MIKRKAVFKALFMTDTHHTGINPKSRKDDYFDTSLKKVDECVEISEKENVDVILHGGDLTNTPYLSYNVQGKIGERYKKFKKPVYVVAGNHDLGEGNDIKNLPNTTLGVLNKHGIVNTLKHKEKIMFEKDGVSIQITGAPSCFGIDKNKDYYIVDEKEADIAIHMVHGMLLKDSNNAHMSYVPLDYVMDETKADVTLSGHWHLGFDLIEHMGKLFVNPGALVRKYNFLEEISRKPKVSIITVYDDKTIDHKFIELECAKLGEDVLDREKMLEQQEYDKKLDEFKSSFKMNDTVLTFAPIEETIKIMGEKHNLDDEIIKECLVRIDKSKSELDVINTPTNKGLYITRIIGHNFQSYSHIELDLVSGVNVFIGESDHGKTALGERMLEFNLFNSLRGDFFIRDTGKLDNKGNMEKEKLCYVTTEWSNGMEVTRKIQSKKSIYELVDENGEIQLFEGFGSTVPKAIIEATGIQKYKIDKDIDFNLNIIPARGISLIEQNGNLKSKFIGNFAGTNSSDVSIRGIQSDIKNNSMNIKIIENDISVLEEEIETMSSVEKKKIIVDEINSTFEKLKKNKSKYDELIKIQTRIKEKESLIEQCDKVISKKDLLEKMELKILKAESYVNKIEKLQNYNLSLERISKNILFKQQEIIKCDNVLKYKNQIINISKLLDEKEQRLNKIKENMTNYQVKINTLNNYKTKIGKKQENLVVCNKTLKYKDIVIERAKKIERIENSIRQYATTKVQLENKYNYLVKKKNDITQKEYSIQKGTLCIEEKKKEREALIDEVVQDIIKLGKCPLCLSDLDDKHISKIREEIAG